MEIEEIEFKGEQAKDEQYVPYVPYTPSTVKMITQGRSKPSLCKIGNGMGTPHVYEVENMRMTVVLRITEEHEDWEEDTPLAMCRYVRPEGEMLFNPTACEDATRENARREQHNKFVVDIFREFMATYDCGASANRMTLPQAPENFVESRLEKIKELKKDKLGSTQKAIEYLARYEIYCGRDYKFEEAFEKANDVSFDKVVEERRAKGKVRVRIDGRRPCWWNGSDRFDESGCRIKWKRGECHTFLTPDLRVVKDETEDQLIVAEQPEAEEPKENPFAALFPPKASNSLTIQEAPLVDDDVCSDCAHCDIHINEPDD